LRVSGSLTSLNLSSNNLTGKTGYIKVTEVSGSSFNVGDQVTYQGREMTISMAKYSGSDIEMNDLSGIKELASAIAVSGSLTSLNLRCNNIGPEGGKAVAEALRVNGSLTSLDVSDNHIGEEVAIELVNIFKDEMKQMAFVGLGSCDLGSDGAKIVGEYLQGSRSLTSLDLSDNMIGNTGAAAIAEALKVNGSLTELNLRGNNFDADDRAIRDALKVNGSLTTSLSKFAQHRPTRQHTENVSPTPRQFTTSLHLHTFYATPFQ